MKRRLAALAGSLALVALTLGTAGTALAVDPALTVTPITWNVIGLDSNDTADGPNLFPVGARVCAPAGAAATGVSASFVWDESAAPLAVVGPTTIQLGNLAAAACADAYFNVSIVRADTSYDVTRNYRITASGTGVSTGATPTGWELYVERLVSQNRNTTLAITGGTCSDPADRTTCNAAPTSLSVGTEYTIKLWASTATGGYEQLEAYLTFPTSIFRIVSASSQYSTTPISSSTSIYADACGWVNDPSDVAYHTNLSCSGTGKAGNDVVVTYVIEPVTAGSGSLQAMIYDYSGSSYHYNSDFGSAEFTVPFTVTVPTYDLTTSTVGDGSVSRSTPGTVCTVTDKTCSTHDGGTLVTLTATAAAGWTFTGWSGTGAPAACLPAVNPCVVTMDQARDIVATFVENASPTPPPTAAPSGGTAPDTHTLAPAAAPSAGLGAALLAALVAAGAALILAGSRRRSARR